MQKGIKLTGNSIQYPFLSDKSPVTGCTSLAGVQFSENQSLPDAAIYESSLNLESAAWLQMQGIPFDRLVLAKQVHGNRNQYVTKPGLYTGTDGFYTDVRDLFLIIRTADCAAVLVFFPDVPAVGIAHSGWRGAHQGIAERLIANMRDKWPVSPRNIRVALSPFIKKCCYEVGSEFRNYFPPKFLENRDGKLFFDLEGVLIHQLTGRGIPEKNIVSANHCTACAEIPLYSYRKHRTSQRLINLIYMKGESDEDSEN